MSEEQENVSIKQTEKIILIIIEVIAVLAAIIFFTFPIFSDEVVKKNGVVISNVKDVGFLD